MTQREHRKSWATISFDLLFENVTSSVRKLPRAEYLPSGRYAVIDQGADLIGGFSDDDGLVHPGPLPAVGDSSRKGSGERRLRSRLSRRSSSGGV